MNVVQSAIEQRDAATLQAVLAADHALADEVIRWGPNGKNASCPLHYICDLQFAGHLDDGIAAPLADALIAAGANIDFRQPSGDTPLIAAASLLAPAVALRLIRAGADIHARGLFGATALHWAANLGLADVVASLIAARADLALRDTEYRATPLGWAVHGRTNDRANGDRDPLACVVLLRNAGAAIEQRWLTDPAIAKDAALSAALRAD